MVSWAITPTLLLVALALVGSEGSEHQALQRRMEALEAEIHALHQTRSLPAASMEIAPTVFLQRDAGKPNKRSLSVSAKFKMKGPHLGEDGEMPDELKELQQEIDELKAKVRSAEKAGMTEQAFEEQQAVMQEKMLEQQLETRLKQKQLDLDSEASRSKRDMSHQLQHMNLQAASDKEQEGNRISSLQLKVNQEAAQAKSANDAAQAERDAAAQKLARQQQELSKMRAMAESMEADVEDLQRNNVAVKAQAANVAANVKHIQRQKALMDAATRQEQAKAEEAGKALQQEESKLKQEAAAEAQSKASGLNNTAQAKALAAQLAQEQGLAAGVRAEQELVDKMSGELLKVKGQIHREGFAGAAKQLALKGKEQRDDQRIQQLQTQQSDLEAEGAKLTGEAKAGLAKLEKDQAEERSALKRDLQAEAAEISREMKAESITDQAERTELLKKINQTNVRMEEERVAGKAELEDKKQRDKHKKAAALDEIVDGTKTSTDAAIKARYASAMQTVNAMKQQDRLVQRKSESDVQAVQSKLKEDIRRVQLKSKTAIEAAHAEAQAQIGKEQKLVEIEKSEMTSDQTKMSSAAHRAHLHEKSAIARAMAGEQEAVDDALREAVHFAQDKAAAATAEQDRVLKELGRVIAHAAPKKAAEDAAQAKLEAKLSQIQAERDVNEKALATRKAKLAKLKKTLQEVRSKAGSTALRVRKHAATIAKLQAEYKGFRNANRLLKRQLKEAVKDRESLDDRLHAKLKLQTALEKQLRMLEVQLAAANKTETSLSKVKTSRQDAADAETEDNKHDSKATEAALDALEAKAAGLKRAEDTAKDAKGTAKGSDSPEKSVSWTSLLFGSDE